MGIIVIILRHFACFGLFTHEIKKNNFEKYIQSRQYKFGRNQKSYRMIRLFTRLEQDAFYLHYILFLL